MTHAKKILITTESHELFVIRRRGLRSTQRLCHLCSIDRTVLTLDEATEYAGISTWDLIQQIEAATIHAFETAAGRLLICQESLKTFCNGEKERNENAYNSA